MMTLTFRRLLAGAVLLGTSLLTASGTYAQTCHLRMVNAMPDVDSVKIELHPTSSAEGAYRAFPLARYHVRKYQTLAAGRYEARIRTDGQDLRHLRFGCDGGGYYTLILVGLDPRDADRGASVYDRLKTIFGGIEAYVDRGYILQPLIMRDDLPVARNMTGVRLLHAAPGLVPIDLSVQSNGTSRRAARKVRYARVSALRSLQPRAYRSEVRFHGARQPALTRTLRLESATIYTVIAIGTLNRETRPLELMILSNPMRDRLVQPRWTGP